LLRRAITPINDILHYHYQPDHDRNEQEWIRRFPNKYFADIIGESGLGPFDTVARSSEIFCINSYRVISFFSINSLASASVCARLETRSSSIVTGLLSGSAIVLPYLNTFSARIITTGGIFRPRALAVLRLITNSNLVGCSTGRSAGLAPLRILSTITATRL